MKVIYLVTFLLVSLSISAQQWQTELPYTSGCPQCSIRDFITTNDNGFLVLLRSIDEEEEAYTKLEHTMVKYDSLGNFEWDRNYDFGVSGPWGSSSGGGATPKTVIQLANGNYMMPGWFRGLDSTLLDVDTTYMFIMDTQGDSILYSEVPNYQDLQYVNNEIFTFRKDDLDNFFISNLSDIGEIIEETELENGRISTMIVSQNNEIYAYRGLNPRSYKKYNENGALLYENPTFDRASIIVANELGGISAYEEDLIKMDSNLNVIWQYTHDEIYPGIPENAYEGSDIIQTQDEGCIVAGYIFDDFVFGVSMTKYDSEGNRLWGGTYPSDVLPMTYLHQVKEVSDGLVVLGGNRFTEEIWLVKLYRDGNWVVNTEDLLDSKKNMTVFPNPGNGNININFFEQVSGQINILNSKGHRIKELAISNTNFVQQFLSDLPNGFYGVQFVDQNGYQSTVKYIKI